MISVEDAIQKFKDIIGDMAAWQLLKKSQFVNLSAIFQSIALRDALWKIERAEQEFFSSTALNAASIRARMEDVDYIPRKAQPSTGTIKITNNEVTSVTLNASTGFMASNGTRYENTSAATIPAGATTSDIAIQQTEKVSYTYTVDREIAFYEILLPVDITDSVYEFEVYVDEAATGSFVEWAHKPGFRNASAGELIYDEFYSHTGSIGIRLGNTTFGKIPPLGADIRVDVWKTSGETSLLSGQKLSQVSYSANITVETTSAITGGSPAETIEESRKALAYWPVYNDKLVWAGDFSFFIENHIAGINWLKVWGEQEQEEFSGPDAVNINKVFVSGMKDGVADATLSAEITALLAETKPLNKSFEWVTPTTSAVALAITGAVPKKENLNEVIQGIESALSAKFSLTVVNRQINIHMRDIYEAITGTGHFDEKTAYFSVAVSSGSLTASAPNEIIYIDADNSTYTIEHL